MTGQPLPRSARTRVPMLDVLRGAAVLAVFLQHLGDRFRPFVTAELATVLPRALADGVGLGWAHAHWGVDLFFVLSGFTLGLGFAHDHARGVRGAALEFFARRAARILPGFYVALLVHLLASPSLFARPHLPDSLLWHFLVLQGYHSPGAITLIGASWSLTTECHFYVIAPWLSRTMLHCLGSLSEREGLRRMLLLVGATCAAVWFVRGVLHDLALLPTSRPGMLELTQRKWVLCRLDQFCLGLGAAVVHHRYAHRIGPRALVGASLVAASALLLGLAVPFDAYTWGIAGGNPAYACVSIAMTVLVLGAAMLPGPPHWWSAPWRALGVVSYGVFLYHQLALDLVSRWLAPARRVSWDGLWWTLGASLALACGLGAASWYLVESPAMGRVSRWTRARSRARADGDGSAGRQDDSAGRQDDSAPHSRAPA